MVDLAPNTVYYVKAYATNSVGTSYGNQQTFSTIPLEPDSTFTDPRDGQVYTFRHMGRQVWMTQNLNYVIRNSWCYDKNPANCAVYGRLYTYSAALSAVPPGWHLPSLREWSNFIEWYLGGNYVAGGKMKEAGTAHWLSPNTDADNSSGFTALPAGMRFYDGSFIDLGQYANWWVNESCGSNCAMEIYISYDHGNADGNSSGGTDISNALSVRCIRDY